MVWIRKSILWRQNTVAQFIATRPIMDLCKQATRRPGERVSRRWWEQTGIDLKGAREKAVTAAAEPETGADLEAESEDEPERASGEIGEEESQGASGSSGAEGGGGERGGGRLNLDFHRAGINGEYITQLTINLRGAESSDLIAAVLGWNSTAQ